MSRLYNVLEKCAADAYIESGTTDGWTWKRYADGTMKATKDVSTISTWNTVVSPIAANQTPITPPSNMGTVTGGTASIVQSSLYIVNAQIQLLTAGPTLTVHRLATSSASISFTVTLEGTYSA